MMKELLKKLQKKSNKKGFTLVEIIVVLVILAILAAIAVERYIQEARSIYVVIQTEEAKSKALEEATPTYGSGTANADATKYTGDGICKKAFDMTGLQVTEITAPTDSNKYYNLTWKSDDGKTINAHLTKNKDVKIISKSK